MIWMFTFVVLLLLAAVDLGSLWRASRTGRPPVLSSFTLACQTVFALFGVLHVGPKAFAQFSRDGAVLIGVLAFLVLMLVGFVADVRTRRRVSP
ncbi:MAG: hypothetical protein WD226_05890 [Planctomycetota bacterium]